MPQFEFEWSAAIQAVPALLVGAKLTLIITLGGLFFGFILGATAGWMKLSANSILRFIANFYIESIRGTPFLVQVMFLYFGVPMAMGFRIPPLAAAIIALSLNAGAYIAEIVRGAVQSIDRGQVEAGRSIGLTSRQTMMYVVWPQAFRRMIPPLGNQFIISLKDTSILVVIGVGELTRTGQEIIANNFRAFEVWFSVAVLYFLMTYSLTLLLKRLEYRVSASERVRAALK
ncbi:amino acid ABC transporter permease [Mesorhizobium sp. A623]